MSIPPRALGRAATALATISLLVGCAPDGPTAAPSGPPASARPAAEVYAEIRTAVEAIRGLQPTAAVEPVSITPEEATANLAAEFDAENDPEELEDSEALLITLGLLPPGTSIRAITLDFQSGQIAGYYSPAKDELFVVSRGRPLDASDRVTYAHEFTHQLQDQNIDLDTLGFDASDQSDRHLARLGLVEGDAVSAQSAWMEANLTAQELGELLAVALSPTSIDALRRAPPYLRETALFPYQDGAAFASRILADGGYDAVDAAYADPPDSTEQVLHPDKYLQRETPTEIEVPPDLAGALGSGWSVVAEDTLGELILRVWLREGKATLAEARTATGGWGGDRVTLLRGPNDAVGVGLITTWDSAADAAEFSAAAAKAVDELGSGGIVVSDGLLRVYVAMGDRAPDVLAAIAR